MKKELKGFLIGTLTTSIILTTTFTTFSEPLNKTIEATYENIKVYVDGKLIQPKDVGGNVVEPFTSNGTTYLPVRAVSQALGKEVSWDDETKSVYIGIKPVITNNTNNSNSTETTKLQEVTVSTVEEFVKALGSNKRIILKPGVYDLSTVYDVNGADSSISWAKVSDGKELNLKGVSNLSIEGDGTDKVEIITTPRYAEIFRFTDSKNISLKNIVAGHTPSKYTCNAGVVSFTRSENILIANSELYGCGSIGVSLKSTNKFNMIDSQINHCSLRALSISGSSDIKFRNTKFIDHEAYSNIMYVSNSKNVLFEDSLFENNNYLTWSFAELSNDSNITFNKCKINNNILAPDFYKDISLFRIKDYTGNSGGTITIKETEITSNTATRLVDLPDYLIIDNCKIENNSWQK